MAKTKKTEEVVVKKFPEATVNDFNVIIKPIITEKTMKLIQENNAITVKVAKKTEVGTTAYFLLSTNSGYGEIIAVTTAEK